MLPTVAGHSYEPCRWQVIPWSPSSSAQPARVDSVIKLQLDPAARGLGAEALGTWCPLSSPPWGHGRGARPGHEVTKTHHTQNGTGLPGLRSLALPQKRGQQAADRPHSELSSCSPDPSDWRNTGVSSQRAGLGAN
jgi:hypothetical protein